MSTSSAAAAAAVTNDVAKHSHSTVITPYPSVARYRNSQHLDNDPRIGKLISTNRHAFEHFVNERAAFAQQNRVPDCPEMDECVRLMEQAKDAMGRALIHAIGMCKGVPFELAVAHSVDTSLSRMLKVMTTNHRPSESAFTTQLPQRLSKVHLLLFCAADYCALASPLAPCFTIYTLFYNFKPILPEQASKWIAL